MKLVLIHPPCCDPTSPYIALPTLAATLRAHGYETELVDANLEGFRALLNEATLTRLLERVRAQFATLNRSARLNHSQKLEYLALQEALADKPRALQIEPALAVLTSYHAGFLDRARYDEAVQTVESALGLISAAYHPLALDFVEYRTPFGLLSLEEIRREATAEHNPFHAYFETLADTRLARAPDKTVVGISFVFPGQLQPGFSLALLLKQKYPALFVVAGGPAMTQLLLRHPAAARETLLGPFDAAVLFEGEQAIVEIAQALDAGGRPARIIDGGHAADLNALPPPDFTGLPLSSYLAPELVLPYDPSRGCYHGKCAFCHYGLAPRGTARYRERSADRIARDLLALQAEHGARLYYLSQDTLAPKLGRALSQALDEAHAALHWSSDIRPERAFDAELCRAMQRAGALSVSLGVESGCQRVLDAMHKGTRLGTVAQVIRELRAAGIAAEAMCFTDFPTETLDEALATLRFLEELRPALSLFICGEFGLLHGSHVANNPSTYGLAETWHVAGDELCSALFFRERVRAKTERDRDQVDRAIDGLSRRFWLHSYPWAGSLSTAHTMLYYLSDGPDAFKARPRGQSSARTGKPSGRPSARPRFELDPDEVLQNEDAIWHELATVRRAVSRQAYGELARKLPLATPLRRRRG